MCAEEEDAIARTTTDIDEECVLRRHDGTVQKESNIPPLGRIGQGITTADAITALQDAGVPKPKLLVNSRGHKTTAPTKAQLKAAAAQERWELDAERRALQQLAQLEDTLW